MAYAFISYSHADQPTVLGLIKHMSQLKRDGLLTAWFDEEIQSGEKFGNNINEELSKANIFLAIISPDYLSSNYCYDIEFQAALQRHDKGELRIIPIIAQPCDWKASPFGQLKAIPKDGKPISEFTNENNAFLNIIDELRRIVSATPAKPSTPAESEKKVTKRTYKVKRDFDPIDRLNFRDETFATIYDYFAQAIDEINGVDQIKARFVRQVPGLEFTCIITNRARINNTGYISIGVQNRHDHFGSGNGIAFSMNEQLNKNIYGNNFSIEHDDYELFWERSNPMHQNGDHEKLNAKNIAKLLWEQFIDQVGVNE
ncbi:MAG TPA: toll/interleukin-1 receptor domain-containing protein [Pedobacter sp.]|nr:toll/interleukin-1 receptor domain-containing protein [Pedobacter sp.]